MHCVLFAGCAPAAGENIRRREESRDSNGRCAAAAIGDAALFQITVDAFYFAAPGEALRSIAISMSFCLSDYLSVRSHISKPVSRKTAPHTPRAPRAPRAGARGAVTARVTKHRTARTARTARTETPHRHRESRSGAWRTVSHYLGLLSHTPTLLTDDLL